MSDMPTKIYAHPNNIGGSVALSVNPIDDSAVEYVQAAIIAERDAWKAIAKSYDVCLEGIALKLERKKVAELVLENRAYDLRMDNDRKRIAELEAKVRERDVQLGKACFDGGYDICAKCGEAVLHDDMVDGMRAALAAATLNLTNLEAMYVEAGKQNRANIEKLKEANATIEQLTTKLAAASTLAETENQDAE